MRSTEGGLTAMVGVGVVATQAGKRSPAPPCAQQHQPAQQKVVADGGGRRVLLLLLLEVIICNRTRMPSARQRAPILRLRRADGNVERRQTA